MTQEYTYKQMQQMRGAESGPIRQRWYKHKNKDVYKYQLDIFAEMGDYEEVQ